MNYILDILKPLGICIFIELVLDKLNIMEFTRTIFIGNLIGCILAVIFWELFLKKRL